MQSRQAYYLQQMGYTVWQQRKIKQSVSCQCQIATHGLDQATLLCCLDRVPDKSEKDLWVFLAMAFDFSQQYYLAASPVEAIENAICPGCIESWLDVSGMHHAIVFGDYLNNHDNSAVSNLLQVPSLAQMLEQPKLKKQCFMDIQQFLCQQHLVI